MISYFKLYIYRKKNKRSSRAICHDKIKKKKKRWDSSPIKPSYIEVSTEGQWYPTDSSQNPLRPHQTQFTHIPSFLPISESLYSSSPGSSNGFGFCLLFNFQKNQDSERRHGKTKKSHLLVCLYAYVFNRFIHVFSFFPVSSGG